MSRQLLKSEQDQGPGPDLKVSGGFSDPLYPSSPNWTPTYVDSEQTKSELYRKLKHFGTAIIECHDSIVKLGILRIVDKQICALDSVYLVESKNPEILRTCFLLPSVSLILFDQESFNQSLSIANLVKQSVVNEPLILRSLLLSLRPDLELADFRQLSREMLGIDVLQLDMQHSISGARSMRIHAMLYRHALERLRALSPHPDTDPTELSSQLYNSTRSQLLLTRASSSVLKYWSIAARRQELSDALIAKLSPEISVQQPKIISDTERGQVILSARPLSRIDLVEFKRTQPLVAATILKEEASIASVEQALARRGVGAAQIEQGVNLVSTLRQASIATPKVQLDYSQLYQQDLGVVQKQPEFRLKIIHSHSAMEQLVRQLESQSVLSLDIKTSGPPGGRQDRDIRLIQIAVDSLPSRVRSGGKGRVYLIDVESIEKSLKSYSANEPDFDCEPLRCLKPLLENPNIVKAIHHSNNERLQFESYGIKLNNVFDTREVASRMRPDLPSHGIQAASREILGILIPKLGQAGDWGAPDLSFEQHECAALHAEIALKLYRVLAPFEAKVKAPIPSQVAEMQHEYFELYAEQLKVGAEAGLGNDYWEESARQIILRKAIFKSLNDSYLKDGAPVEIVTPLGTLSCRPSESREIIIDRLRNVFPDIALEVIKETCTKEALIEELKRADNTAAEINQIVAGLYKHESFTDLMFESRINPAYLHEVEARLRD